MDIKTYDLAKAHFRKHNFKEWAECLETSAKCGDPMSEYEYGHCLMVGSIEIPKNPERGIEYLLRAARNGVAVAMHRVANILYTQGRYDEAFYWFKQTEQKTPTKESLQKDIALCYFHGHGVKQDRKEAVFYLRQVANSNSILRLIARSWLVKCYMNGWGVCKNARAAQLWKEKVKSPFHSK